MKVLIGFRNKGRNDQIITHLPEAPQVGDEIGVLSKDLFLVRQRRWMVSPVEGSEPYLVLVCL